MKTKDELLLLIDIISEMAEEFNELNNKSDKSDMVKYSFNFGAVSAFESTKILLEDIIDNIEDEIEKPTDLLAELFASFAPVPSSTKDNAPKCDHKETKIVEDSCYRGKIETEQCLVCGEILETKIIR